MQRKLTVFVCESLEVFLTFLRLLHLRTLHVHVPAVPFLKTSAVHTELLPLHRFLLVHEVDGRSYASIFKSDPVDSFEKLVLFDFGSSLLRAESFLWLDFEESG